jgi:hypothetical protein
MGVLTPLIAMAVAGWQRRGVFIAVVVVAFADEAAMLLLLLLSFVRPPASRRGTLHFLPSSIFFPFPFP